MIKINFPLLTVLIQLLCVISFFFTGDVIGGIKTAVGCHLFLFGMCVALLWNSVLRWITGADDTE